jgi:hypothetical protein
MPRVFGGIEVVDRVLSGLGLLGGVLVLMRMLLRMCGLVGWWVGGFL